MITTNVKLHEILVSIPKNTLSPIDHLDLYPIKDGVNQALSFWILILLSYKKLHNVSSKTQLRSSSVGDLPSDVLMMRVMMSWPSDDHRHTHKPHIHSTITYRHDDVMTGASTWWHTGPNLYKKWLIRNSNLVVILSHWGRAPNDGRSYFHPSFVYLLTYSFGIHIANAHA